MSKYDTIAEWHEGVLEKRRKRDMERRRQVLPFLEYELKIGKEEEADRRTYDVFEKQYQSLYGFGEFDYEEAKKQGMENYWQLKATEAEQKIFQQRYSGIYKEYPDLSEKPFAVQKELVGKYAKQPQPTNFYDQDTGKQFSAYWDESVGDYRDEKGEIFDTTGLIRGTIKKWQTPEEPSELKFTTDKEKTWVAILDFDYGRTVKDKRELYFLGGKLDDIEELEEELKENFKIAPAVEPETKMTKGGVFGTGIAPHKFSPKKIITKEGKEEELQKKNEKGMWYSVTSGERKEYENLKKQITDLEKELRGEKEEIPAEETKLTPEEEKELSEYLLYQSNGIPLTPEKMERMKELQDKKEGRKTSTKKEMPENLKSLLDEIGVKEEIGK